VRRKNEGLPKKGKRIKMKEEEEGGWVDERVKK